MVSVESVISSIMEGLFWVFLLGGIFITLFIVIVISKYKHKVTVRQVTNSNKRVMYVSAKDHEEKGNKYLKLSRKDGIKFPLMPYPPSDAIETDNKGKLVVEAYLSNDGIWSFRTDNWSFKNVPQEILDLKADSPNEYKIRLKQWKDQNKNVIDDRPMSANAKYEIVKQLKKAEEFNKKGMTELIRDAMPYVFVAMMLVVALVFYEDITKPAKQMADDAKEMQKLNLKITELQAEIMEDLKQTIKQEQVLDGKDIITNNNINDDDNS